MVIVVYNREQLVYCNHGNHASEGSHHTKQPMHTLFILISKSLAEKAL